MAGLSLSAQAYPLNDGMLFKSSSEGNQTVFYIPEYQRPYVWKQKDWEQLFADITENDNGYFVGTILCVNNGSDVSNDYLSFEVVDGQQRLTTLSLFLAAIYNTLKEYGDELDDEQKVKLFQYKTQLTVKTGQANDKRFVTRVVPQQEDNVDDYLNTMIESAVVDKAKLKNKPLNKKDGRHQIPRAYTCFKGLIKNYAVGDNDEYKNDVQKQIERIFELSEKVNSTTLVMIKTDSHASANTLFETLNNRGVPLTITDLIKNNLLGKLKSDKNYTYDFSNYKEEWDNLIRDTLFKSDAVPAGEQERFFRQSYNACRFEWMNEGDSKQSKDFPVGKRANLYALYEKMIKSAPLRVFKQTIESSKIYLQIQGDEASGISSDLNSLYKDLKHINGTTSYPLLLYLVKNRDSLKLQESDLKNICKSLINFFVRRNVTNKPTSNKLDQLFNDFIKKIQDEHYTGEKICSELTQKLQAEVGKNFKDILLNENSYDNFGNENVYFILSKLAEAGLHDKTPVDFWAESDKRSPLAWNIEHILPQTIEKKQKRQSQQIHTEWEKVLIDWAKEKGDTRTVKEIQESYMNKLGNLTLTQYNSEMGNKPFLDKRDLQKNGKNIGYKNELSEGLNKDIINKDNWTPDEIDARTEILVKKILEIFAW